MISQIQDVADPNVIIYRHNQTGFYNATKSLKQFYELYHADGLVEPKRPNDWMRQASTKLLITAIKSEFNLEEVSMTIQGGVDTSIQGTYIHPHLYRSFLGWLSPIYTIRIFKVVDKAQTEYCIRLEREKSEMANANDRLERMMREQATKIDDQTARMERLMKFAEKASKDNDNLSEELKDVKEELKDAHKDRNILIDKVSDMEETVNIVKDHLEKKSFTSTKDPENEAFKHFALITHKKVGNVTTLKFSSGQSDYIDKRKSELLAEGHSIHTDKHYHANGIDHRRNIESEMNKLIETTLDKLNESIILKREELQRSVDERNAMLQEDIIASNIELAERVRVHNETATRQVKLSKNGLRYYCGRTTYATLRQFEKERILFNREVATAEYKLITIPIKVNSTSITWRSNRYISLKDVDQLISKIHKETQESPYQTSESEGSDSE